MEKELAARRRANRERKAYDVSTHAMENLASGLDGEDDGRQPLVEEYYICGGLSSVGSTLDGDTAVGLLECRSVVDTVTGHSDEVTALHEHSARTKGTGQLLRE